MLYFFLNIPPIEIEKLENTLPRGSFCLYQVQIGTNRYYGMIRKDMYDQMLKSLSPETMANLEKIDKSIFKLFFLQNIGDRISCIGNRSLLAHLSDE